MKIAKMNVDLIDRMGSDLTVANAARVSFDKASEWEQPSCHCGAPAGQCWSQSGSMGQQHSCDRGEPRLSERDAKLIGYLAKHNHWTPFGHCFVQFRVKAPIFVARQLVKHQVGLVWNEVSRRYVDSEPEFWFPEEWRGRPEGSMKQGSSGVPKEVASVDWGAKEITKDALDMYLAMLSWGCSPEQARMILPQNMMTEWYWSGSLAAFHRVCKLRLDPHAQAETAEIAKQIDAHCARLFPVSWTALSNG